MTTPAIGIPAIAAGMTALVIAAVWQAWARDPRAALAAAAGAALWWSVPGVLAATGTLHRMDVVPPPMALMILGVLAGGIALGTSEVGRRVAATVPLWALILAQGFRLPLELVMHQAALEGLMPPELTWTGYNPDVLTGAAACGVALAVRQGRGGPRLVGAWLALGWTALAAIVAVAVATSPMFRLFGDDPRHVNTWVLDVPYVWLPTVLVVIAVAGQIVIMRALTGASIAPPRGRSTPARPERRDVGGDEGDVGP